MTLLYQYLFQTIWITWAIVWLILARNVKATIKIESVSTRFSYNALILLGAYLIWSNHFPVEILNQRIFTPSQNTFWVGILLTLLGLGFSVWARLQLGRNWSSSVTVKQQHELITSGPYRFARHPIYTGIILAFVGAAIARAKWRGVVAIVLIVLGLMMKFKNEERFMREQFGDAYVAYSKRVRAIIPFVI